MKKIILALMVLCSCIFAGEIKVAAAANVSYAMDKLVAEFNKTNPDTKVLVTLGSSGKFVTQIENGAPFDIFMAADMKFPQTSFEENLTLNKPVLYAQGSIAILSSRELDLKKGMDLLKEKSISKIALANPKTAPYGVAAIEAIKNAKVFDDVENKFVYAETISQVITYTTTAADIGFIAKSSMYDEKMTKYKENINWIEVDPKLYTPIDQGIVILKNGKDNKEVKAFYDFILSNSAKKIFTDYGYIVK